MLCFQSQISILKAALLLLSSERCKPRKIQHEGNTYFLFWPFFLSPAFSSKPIFTNQSIGNSIYNDVLCSLKGKKIFLLFLAMNEIPLVSKYLCINLDRTI